MTAPAQSAPAPDSVVWKVNQEMVVLLGWGRAVLLQLAHPLVAAGIAEHSLFLRYPRQRAGRLRHTVQAMLAMTFGTPPEADRAARGINAIHDRINGELNAPAGRFAAGHRYSAHDPALLRWVHATLLESLPLVYELYVGPLTAEEKDRYCAEASGIESLLHIPAGYMPRSTRALRAYMDEMYAGDEIAVGETARRVGHELVRPATAVLAPLTALLNLPTVGLLPVPLRDAYGFGWDPGREALLRHSAGLLRALLPLVPPAWRFWAPARRRNPAYAALAHPRPVYSEAPMEPSPASGHPGPASGARLRAADTWDSPWDRY